LNLTNAPSKDKATKRFKSSCQKWLEETERMLQRLEDARTEVDPAALKEHSLKCRKICDEISDKKSTLALIDEKYRKLQGDRECRVWRHRNNLQLEMNALGEIQATVFDDPAFCECKRKFWLFFKNIKRSYSIEVVS